MRDKFAFLVRFLALVVAFCAVGLAWADTETVDGIEWTYTVVDGKSSIGGGSSSNTAVPKTTSGAITIPATLGGYPVTSIGDWAFGNCRGLTSVTIPDSVTSIGRYAFRNCSGLTSVTIGNGVTSIGDDAFSYCSGFTSVTIPDSVTSIGRYAFRNCSGLTSVTIGNGVTSIGDDAFSDCSGLTSVNVRDISKWCSISFRDDTSNPLYYAHNLLLDGVAVDSLDIPDGVESIGRYAFYHCSGLTSITIPDSVTFIGPYAFYGCSGLTSITIPDSVTFIGPYAFSYCSGLTSVTIPDSVTSIEYQAFSDCSGLTSVTIPDSVTSIGDSAFSGCSGLTSVTIPDSVTSIGVRAFSSCYDLTSVTIPDSVTSIGSYTFFNCIGLTSVTMPSSVTIIGDSAFAYCSGLTSVNIPDSVTSIGDSAFRNCSGLTSVTIPDSVTNIGGKAFSCCSGLESITLPFVGSGRGNIGTSDSVFGYIFGTYPYEGGSKIAQYYPSSSYSYYYIPSGLKSVVITDETTLGSGAFYNCSGLTSVNIPDSVTSIGDSAFSGCSGLTSVTIPDSVTSIGDRAFWGCSGLISVTIGSGVTSIGDHAFSHCSGLTSVTMPDSVTSIGDSAFFNCIGLTSVTIPSSVTSIGRETFYYCSGLTSVTIPDGVTSIGVRAFSSCYDLTSVTIPDSVTSIGDRAFYDCSGLTSVAMGNSVTNIGDSAFYGCSVLTSITIPDSVTSIEDSAFDGCSGLTSVEIGNGVTSIGNAAFSGCSSLTSVTIGSGVISIGYRAFSGCAGLTQVFVPMDCTIAGNAIPTTATVYRYRPVQRVELDVANGMVSPTMLNVTYGGFYGELPIPARIGYSFDYWEFNGSIVSNETVVSAIDDHTLIAHWTPNKYEIKFDANGGEGGTSVIQDYATEIVSPTVTREGYTFTGWSPEVAVTVPAEDVTYTAQWEINQYTITFDANGGEGGKSIAQDYATEILAPTVTREGYTFTGWSQEVAATVPAEDVTYTAQWQINKYTVTFDANGGEGGTIATQYYATEIVAPMVTREGYTFTGWSPEVAATVPAEDVTYTAQWEINQYTITFDANGGEGGTSEKQDYLTEIVAPTVTREGYTFVGWDKEVASIVPANDLTYVAQWQINQYTVAFDANGGVGGTSVTQDYATEIVAPTVTREGYTFKGWSPEVAATVPAEDVTYTAQWEINQYTITFDANGGEGGWSGKRYYDTVVVAPEVTREGYTFIGWDNEVAAKVPANDISYTALWQINQYDVVFDANGGEGGTSVTQDYATEIVSPTVTREGYTFTGWSPEVAATVPASDVTYTAQWVPNKYEIKFDANGGTGGWIDSLDYESEFAAPVVTRTGYSFVKWSPAVAETVPLGGATYVALWQINQYDVVFDANGGEGGSVAKQDYATAIVPPVVTREGHTFKGWLPEVAATVPAEDVAYVAQWEINQYTVTFDANGGGGGKIDTLDYGMAIVAPVVTREGHTFDGWLPDVAANVPASDVTYIAQWVPNKYTVTFDANGGEGGTAEELDYATEIVPPAVTREGYTFKGWSPEVATIVPASDVIYTAQWEINQYTVTFDVNGGDGGKVETLDYGSVIVAPVVARIGYTFAGWLPEVAATVPACDVAYTAQWTINSYKVTFAAQGGVIDEGERNVDYNDTVGELPLPVKDDAEFLGWWTEPDGGEQVDETMIVTDAKTIYAHWLYEVAAPVVTPGDGAVFKTDSCEISITCETEGATIYYSAAGKTPKITDSYLYSEPFTITDSATIMAVAVFGKLKSEYVTVSITKKLLTLEDALDASDSIVVETSTENPWIPILDNGAKVGDGMARSAAIGDNGSTWLTATVEGSGTLSFWCKVSCEQDDGGIFTWDRLEVYTNDVPVCEWYMDGKSDWVRREVAFSSGVNTVKWMYCKDEDVASGEDCVWLDELVWTPLAPSIERDDEATIAGDRENGYTIKPSEGNKEVVVAIPDGVEPEKVTVEVSAEVETVKSNGANVKVMKGADDITEHLDLAAVTQDGVINISSAQVKEEVVKEALDTEKGAEVNISNPESPELTTTETKPGLTYTLLEGATLEEMMSCANGDSKVGDGTKWTPTITVKGGTSGFYTIKVEK